MLFRVSAGRAGARVRQQEILVTDRAITDSISTALVRDPGQDLVSKPPR